MKGVLESIYLFLIGDMQADRVVPPRGHTVRLTVLATATMAFLATIAMSFSTASGRLADRWTTELARSATIRISAPETQIDAQTRAVIKVLETTRGVDSFRTIDVDEQRKLLAPWFGEDLAVTDLPLPQLIEVVETESGVNLRNLKLRLAAEAPGAVFDDHGRWREPLVQAATKIRLLGWLAMAVIGLTLMVIVSLATQSALAANQQVIKVLRLIGARDSYIVQAFVRRFTIRSFFGGCIGVILAAVTLRFMPSETDPAGLFVGLRLTGFEWVRSIWVPIAVSVVAYFTTNRATHRALRKLP